MEKTRIQKYYNNVVVEDLLILYNYRSVMQLPCLEQAVLNMSSKNFLLDKQEILNAFAACLLLTGQRGVATRARKSIAAFQLRKDSMLGCVVTVRRNNMFALFDKVLTFVLPRSDETKGSIHQSQVSVKKTFTGYRPKGSLAIPFQPFLDGSKKHFQLGIKEATLFPEIESMFEGLSMIKGLNVVFSLSTHRFKRSSVWETDRIEDGHREKFNRHSACEPADLIFLSAFQYPNLSTKSVS